MWLFTTIGFFSVVRKDGEQHLTVRARSSADLDRLRTTFMPELSATTSKKGTDYPFRATINQQAFAKGMASIGESIDYHNFKDEGAVKMGKKRAGTPADPPFGPGFQEGVNPGFKIALAEQSAPSQDHNRVVELAVVAFVERANVQTSGRLKKSEVSCRRGTEVADVGRINPVQVDRVGSGVPAW